VKVKEGILVHASKILDPEFQVVNQNKSKVMMPASFLNNQSAGTVALLASFPTTVGGATNPLTSVIPLGLIALLWSRHCADHAHHTTSWQSYLLLVALRLQLVQALVPGLLPIQ
jgi:hypothetical protein